MTTRHISPPDLEGFVHALLTSIGTPTDTADVVATALVRADLCDHGSHGVRLLPGYVQLVKEGLIDPTEAPDITDRTPILQVDGNGAFGQLTGIRTIHAAIEEAAATGRSMAGIRNGGHLGRIGELVERATDAGLMAWCFVNGPREIPVVPHGGSTIRLCTNPVAFGVPTFDAFPFSIVLDMATSQSAYGEIKRYEALGKSIPEGWAVTPDGEPITDPSTFDAVDGQLLPLGGHLTGHKGYGLAVIAECVASIVGNGPILGDRADQWGNGAAICLVDPLQFSDRATITAELTTMADHLTDHDDDVMLPGEPEYRAAQSRREHGIPLAVPDCQHLGEVARSHGVDRTAIPTAMQS